METPNLEKLLEEIFRLIEERKKQDKTIPVGISNRHIHLSKEHVEVLFGKDYSFEKIKDLSQVGQFACKETVTICGPKGCIEKVRVLGPERKYTQVEVSAGDCIKLGIKSVVRLSGDITGTPGITVVGPKGSIYLHEGVIVSQRHIHMTPEDATKFNVKDGDKVAIKVTGERGGVLENTIIRVTTASTLECHLDVEEANAFGLNSKSRITILEEK